MIDFGNVEIQKKYYHLLLNNPNLIFVNPHTMVTEDGIIVERFNPRDKMVRLRCSSLGWLIIDIHIGGQIFLYGSFMKYFYKGSNYKDYSIDNFIETVDTLNEYLNINLYNFEVKSIELSVTISDLPIPVNLVMKGMICAKVSGSNKFYPFSREYDGGMKRIKRSVYDIKVYDKGKQSKVDQDLFRFEIKTRSNRKLKQCAGIVENRPIVLGDLTNDSVLSNLGSELIKVWKQIIMFDFDLDLDENNMNLSNVNYWEHLKSTTLTRAKNKLYRLSKNEGSNIHEIIQYSISEKWSQLCTASSR